MTKASDSAEPFGPERLDLSSSTGLKAEGLVAGHQSLRKDIMTFLHHRIHLSANNEYAFFGRTTKIRCNHFFPLKTKLL
jgi:hypothetical protein